MKELVFQFVTHAEIVALRDLVYFATNTLPATLLGFAFLIAARWLILRLASTRGRDAGSRDRNTAIGLIGGSYLLSLGLAISGFLLRQDHGPVWHGPELYTESFLAAGLLVLGICCASQPILRSFSVLRRGTEPQNVPAAVCVAGCTLGNGLILNGALADGSRGFTQALQVIFVYWIFGQALFRTAGWLYRKTSTYDVQHAICDDNNLVAALNFGGFLLSLGIIVRTLLTGFGDDSLGWKLFAIGLISLFGVLLTALFLRVRSYRRVSFRGRLASANLASAPENSIVDVFITVAAAVVFCASMQHSLWMTNDRANLNARMSAEVAVPVRSAARVGRLPPAPDGTFSIAVIPDTQHYRGAGTKSDPIKNVVFDSYVNWVVNNVCQQRLVFATHSGDVVDKNMHAQWKIARRIMDRLHGVIPYGISVGNHDMARSGDSSLFQCYFPKRRFQEFDWYAASFERTLPQSSKKWMTSLFDSVRQFSLATARSANNANSCQLFSAEGLDFVILHLECNAPDDVLLWADEMLLKYRSRRAIVTTHMDLGRVIRPPAPYVPGEPVGRLPWHKCHIDLGNSAEQMWKKCFRKHANLFMICSGDQSEVQALHKTSVGDHGNAVYSLMADYGEHGLRVIRFVPASDRIEVRTWNPIVGQLCVKTDIVPDRRQHQFELDYEMRADLAVRHDREKQMSQKVQVHRSE